MNPPKRSGLLLMLLFLSAGVLVRGLFGVAYPSEQAQYSDLLISHDPNTVFLRRSILRDGVVPLWSPAILGGYPFAANPLSGLWYPPGWLALLLPLPLGFTLVMMVHLLWGGMGMVRFLEAKGVHWMAAFLGGAVFAVLPKLIAHYGAGHLTLVYAVPWTPWLLWSARKGNPPWRSGLILGLIFLADPRWAVYAGGIWVMYSLAHRHNELLDWGKDMGGGIAIAFLLSAPLAFPLLQYAKLSTRKAMEAGEVLTHSLPPAGFLGLFFPSGGGNPEWAMYGGGVVLGLVIFTISRKEVRKENRFWIGSALITSLLALGSHFPGLEYAAEVPGLNLLRVPPRALFLTNMSLVISASSGLSAWLRGTSWNRAGKLALAGTGGFLLSMAGGVGAITGQFSRELIWGTLAFTAGAVLIFFWQKRELTNRMGWLLVGLCLLDVVGAGHLNYHVRSYPNMPKDTEEVLALLEDSEKPFRVYSPSYSVPQDYAARLNLELAGGVDPLHLHSYARFMEEATGVPYRGYSVSIPPFPGGDPETANQSAQPDPYRLGMLNVRYLISAFPLSGEGLTQLERRADCYLYRNDRVFPRAWVMRKSQMERMLAHEVDPEDVGPAVWERLTPNAIRVRAEGPGELIVSEVTYPGWEAKLDGQRVSIKPVAGILRGIELPPGEHQIDFHFRPNRVYIGSGFGAAGILLVLYLAFKELYDQRKTG